jgi:type I restriction enzyme S subunit
LFRISLIEPPVEEQDIIVHYLASMDKRINQFIRNRRKFIEILNEQKQAIINRAVTGQIDVHTGKPYPRYKPTGIEWLWDIPEHWELRRLKYLVRNVNEQTETKRPDDAYIALEHVESWTGRLSFFDGEVAFDSQVKRFSSNDVLFGKLRPYLAKVTRPQTRGVCVGEFLVLRIADSDVLPAFIEQKLRSHQMIDLINSSTFGAKMPRADWAFVGSVAIAYPPTHEEQQVILNHIEEQTAALLKAITRAQREIDLIREYRTRLIADVVTGKLDVRGFASALDKEPAEMEDVDEGIDDEEISEEGELEFAEEVTDAND